MNPRYFRRRPLPKVAEHSILKEKTSYEKVQETLRKYKESPEILTADEIKLLEDYVLERVSKANPLELNNNFLKDYGTAFNFYLQLKDYRKILDIYLRFKEKIKGTEYEFGAHFVHYVIIAYAKTGNLKKSKELFNLVLTYAKAMNSDQYVKDFLKDQFQKHNIDPKEFGL